MCLSVYITVYHNFNHTNFTKTNSDTNEQVADGIYWINSSQRPVQISHTAVRNLSNKKEFLPPCTSATHSYKIYSRNTLYQKRFFKHCHLLLAKAQLFQETRSECLYSQPKTISKSHSLPWSNYALHSSPKR